MKAFALFLGILFGCQVALGQSVMAILSSVLFVILGGLWAYKRRLLPFLCVSFVGGLLLALALRLIPLPGGSVEALGVVEKTGDDYFILHAFFRRYYVFSKGHGYQVGDVVKIQGTVVEARFSEYESRFSFTDYLHGLGVKGELGNPKITELFSFPLRIREVENRFLSAFSSRGKALVGALVFGRSQRDSDLIVLAERLSLLSLLSGLGLFYSFSLGLLDRFLGKFVPKYADAIGLFVALMPIPFCLWRLGVLRAFLMRLIKVMDGRFLHRKWDYFTRLSFAGIFLLWNPFRAIDTGYLASFGISFCLYLHRYWLEHKNKVLAKVKAMGFIQLFLLPFSLAQGSVHVFGFLFVLLFYPVFLPLSLLGWLSFFTMPFTGLFNGLGDGLHAVFNALTAMDVMVPLPFLSIAGITGYYAIFFLATYLTQVRMLRYRNGLIIGGVGLYLCSLLPIIPALSQSVSFINVGQGDCCLIQDGMTNVLIDTGGVKSFDLAEESLIPYLRKRRIYHLDAVIASHQDYDHVGAVDSLIKNYRVHRYVTEATAFPLSIGKLTFVNHNTFAAREENDKSLVLSLSFMNRKWLFTGDAPVWVEKAIVSDYPDLDVDVLKVGHHGSNTSTCEELLDAITPEIAVISCGYGNKYGHPTNEVLSRLTRRGITIRRTDLEGTITFR